MNSLKTFKPCDYNKGVNSNTYNGWSREYQKCTHCDKCGWNPEVSAERLKRIKENRGVSE